MLSLQLKDLENDGIVNRKLYAEVPHRVEYLLTDFGRSLIPLLEEIARRGLNLAESKGKMVDKERKKKVKKVQVSGGRQ